jgi:hypothetical protein
VAYVIYDVMAQEREFKNWPNTWLPKVLYEPMLDYEQPNIALGATPIGSAAAHPLSYP